MSGLVNECARILHNEKVGPGLHVMKLAAPNIAGAIKPGQFVHMKVPQAPDHVLRRPFSIYAADAEAGTLDILYQEVGTVTRFLPSLESCEVELIGPIGSVWSAPELLEKGNCSHVLLVGGGVGAAPLFMLCEKLVTSGCAVDLVLGAQTKDALVARERYQGVLGREPYCSTDDGTYGRAGFCTSLVEERLREGASVDGAPYDYVAVCGPAPLMKIVVAMASEANVACEVSLERRMACGIGACLSCVVDTVDGKKRACVDGPVFKASEVVW